MTMSSATYSQSEAISTENENLNQRSAAKRKPSVKQSNPAEIIQRAKMSPDSLTHNDVMQLQGTIGNRAVVQMLSKLQSDRNSQTEGKVIQLKKEKEEAYTNKGIRITYNGFLDTILGADAWKLKAISLAEDVVVKIVELIPFAGALPALQEGDYLDAAISLIPEGKVFKGILIVTDGTKLAKAGKFLYKNEKWISRGKTAKDAAEAGYSVATTTYDLKKNKLVLKMVAASYNKTKFTSDTTLLVDFDTDDCYGRDISIDKSNVRAGVDHYSELVYTGKLTAPVIPKHHLSYLKIYQTVMDAAKK